jgi:Flp pilus assembly protein TadD
MLKSLLWESPMRTNSWEVEYKQTLDRDPWNLPVRLNLALSYYTKQDQRYDEARSFERALRVRRRDPAVLSQLATLDLAAGNLDKAVGQLARKQDRDESGTKAPFKVPEAKDR